MPAEVDSRNVVAPLSSVRGIEFWVLRNVLKRNLGA